MSELGNPQWEWANQASSISGSNGLGISVDHLGNAYCTGFFQGTAYFGTTTISITSSGNTDIFVAKIDDSGNWLWAKQAGGASFDQGLGISVDCQGNAYCTGFFVGTAYFGTTTISITSSGSADIFVAKIDDSGNWLWANQAGGASTDIGFGISVDCQGNAYCTGSFRNTAYFGTISITSVNNSQDIFVAKIDASGNWLWATSAGSDINNLFNPMDAGLGISVDCVGNAYCTGYFVDTAYFGTTTITSSDPTNSNIFVAKIDENGNWLWAKQAGGIATPPPGHQGLGISVDCQGNAYCTGFFERIATFDTHTIVSNDKSQDIFVAKIDENGNWLWAKQAGGIFEDHGLGISVDCQGNAYCTGFFRNTAYFGSNTLTSFGTATLTTSGFEDIFVAKIDDSGNWLWAKQAGGASTDQGLGISVDCAGNAYCTGIFGDTAYFGTTTLTSTGSEDIFVAKIPSTNSDPYGLVALDLQCIDPSDNELTLTFNNQPCFNYDIVYSLGTSTMTLSYMPITLGVQTVTLTGLDAGGYSVFLDLKEKCCNNLVASSDPIDCDVPCILPGATIQTLFGSKLIEDIVAGDIVIDEHGHYVKVIHNIKYGMGTKDIVTFKQGSLGNNLPNADLEITYGHPIKLPEFTGSINSFSKKEHIVENLVNRKNITSENRNISCSYALMTKERIFVMTNGVPVCTWSDKEFFEFCANMKKKNSYIMYQLL